LGAVFQHDALGQQIVANAVAFGEILGGFCRISRLYAAFDFILVNSLPGGSPTPPSIQIRTKKSQEICRSFKGHRA
jgi:hypothetical protein